MEPKSRTQTWTYRKLTEDSIQSKILDQDNERVRVSVGPAEHEVPGPWQSFPSRQGAEDFCREQWQSLEAEGWYRVYFLCREQEPNWIDESMVLLPRKQRIELGFKPYDPKSPAPVRIDPEKVMGFLKKLAPAPEAAHLGTALNLAITDENFERVRELVAAGADINLGTDSTWIHGPLAFALSVGHFEIARWLADHGAILRNVPEKLALQMKLLAAVESGDLHRVEALLAEGADPGYIRGELNSQVETAVLGGHLEILRRLLAAGADPNRTFRDPLHFAAAYDSLEMVRVLVEAGADLNARDEDGGTPLCSASGEGRVEVMRFLLARGADVHQGDPLGRAAYDKQLEACRLLWPLVDESAQAAAARRMGPKFREKVEAEPSSTN